MATAIKFEHVSKMYQLGVVGTGTISNDLKRWWQMNVLGKEDPFLKIGQTNDRTTKGSSEFVYALQDITFDVEQGDVIGIIGKNGAGKSTLLKVLSRITAPSSGTIKAKGRIASLLEVGTGFHPELTGRENIYLNGSIMGMRKFEIDRKLDEIVDFAGVERYLDTPTKRYSSGMQVRLGFAVAAFLEPEILVVDEVLAVGDAEFQKKAVGKMQDVATNGGRTVLFVSHNMASVRQLCKHGVVLKNGMVEMVGTSDECVDFYMETNIQDFVSHSVVQSNQHKLNHGYADIAIQEVNILNDVRNMSNEEDIVLSVKVNRTNMGIKCFKMEVIIDDSAGNRVITCLSNMLNFSQEEKTGEFRIIVKNHNLTRGKYSIEVKTSQGDLTSNVVDYDWVTNVASFEVKYLDAKHQQPIVYWPRQFGNCYIDCEASKI